MDRSISLADLYVVLVEPSSTQFHIIRDLLLKFGVANVVHVDTAGAALDAMTETVPDLVISAMHLPDITGTDLVMKMRAESALRDVGFILISSETDVRYLEPIRQAGVVAILPKPFVIDQLRHALYAALDFIEPENISLENHDVEELSVLVVDDSQTARHHIGKTLRALGIENIVEATNGKEAIQLIDKNYFDLVVTDYNMPAMDGNELVRYIREQSKQASIPILMVTSENDVNQLAAVEQSGVSAICDKPFEMSVVRSLIQNIVV
jgi:two-component system chemotaxis response regulator CheY